MEMVLRCVSVDLIACCERCSCSCNPYIPNVGGCFGACSEDDDWWDIPSFIAYFV